MYELLAILIALIGGGGFLYFKGRSAAKSSANTGQLARDLAQAKADELGRRETGRVVSETRTEVQSTPGARNPLPPGYSADPVGVGDPPRVGDAAKSDPKSLQGRLGAMARDGDK